MGLVTLSSRTLKHNFANSVQPLLEKMPRLAEHIILSGFPFTQICKWVGVELEELQGRRGVCVSSVTVISEPEDLQLPEAGREVTCIESSIPPGWHPIEPHAVIRGIMGFVSARSAWLGPSLF